VLFYNIILSNNDYIYLEFQFQTVIIYSVSVSFNYYMVSISKCSFIIYITYINYDLVIFSTIMGWSVCIVNVFYFYLYSNLAVKLILYFCTFWMIIFHSHNISWILWILFKCRLMCGLDFTSSLVTTTLFKLYQLPPY